MKRLAIKASLPFVLLGVVVVLIARYVPEIIGVPYSIIVNIYALLLWSTFHALLFVYQAVPKWAWVLCALALAAYPLSHLTRRVHE